MKKNKKQETSTVVIIFEELGGGGRKGPGRRGKKDRNWRAMESIEPRANPLILLRSVSFGNQFLFIINFIKCVKTKCPHTEVQHHDKDNNENNNYRDNLKSSNVYYVYILTIFLSGRK